MTVLSSLIISTVYPSISEALKPKGYSILTCLSTPGFFNALIKTQRHDYRWLRWLLWGEVRLPGAEVGTKPRTFLQATFSLQAPHIFFPDGSHTGLNTLIQDNTLSLHNRLNCVVAHISLLVFIRFISSWSPCFFLLSLIFPELSSEEGVINCFVPFLHDTWAFSLIIFLTMFMSRGQGRKK